MKYRRRIYYSAEQRAEIWDRWQRGESMSSIGRDYNSERIFRFDKIQSVAAIEGTFSERSQSIKDEGWDGCIGSNCFIDENICE